MKIYLKETSKNDLFPLEVYDYMRYDSKGNYINVSFFNFLRWLFFGVIKIGGNYYSR